MRDRPRVPVARERLLGLRADAERRDVGSAAYSLGFTVQVIDFVNSVVGTGGEGTDVLRGDCQ